MGDVGKVKVNRKPGRLSSKNQITLPVDALKATGIEPGDDLRVEVAGPGELRVVRMDDPVVRFAGSLTGTYGKGYLKGLRDEWE